MNIENSEKDNSEIFKMDCWAQSVDFDSIQISEG